MKKICYFLTIILTFHSFFAKAQTTCQVTAPTANSAWIAGATMTITWNAAAFTTNVNIQLNDYSIGLFGQVVLNIATNIPNTGTYNWVIPNTLPSKCAYAVYVGNVDRTNWCFSPANICIRKSNCDASFSFAPIGDCGNFQFTNTSITPGTARPSYTWNFGDPNSGANNTTTLQNPTHQFSACGTYNVCTTINGNGCTATICNTVTVSDLIAPVARCKPGVGVILDANCQYNVTSAFVDNGSTDNCQIKSLVVNPAIIFGCANTNVTLTVTDWCNNRSTCTMGIQTIETVPPTIVCPPTATVTCATDTIPSVTGTATATDNCPGPITLTRSDLVSGNMPCDATIRRTWTATDACGNKSSCVQLIIVRDNVQPIITNCPSNQTVNANQGVCYYTFPNPLVITTSDCDPNPTITCTWADAAGVVLPLTAQTQFPKGLNTITCTARDKCGNVSRACVFTLTVVDNQPPSITCPLSILVVGTPTPPPVQCKAIISNLAATTGDNCPMVNLTYNITPNGAGGTTASGTNDASATNFMGFSTVVYTATDMGGNTTTCSFTVAVRCDSCACSAAVPSSQNLIANGDFTQGNIGFTSGLTWDNGVINGTGCGSGNYGVHDDFRTFCAPWPIFGAHSAPNFLTIDGFPNPSTATVLWKSPVNLTTTTDYCFSFWWASIYPTGTQTIPISINILNSSGAVVGSITPSTNISQSPAPQWQQSSFSWNSSALASGSYFVAISQTSGAATRDWGIDDICFTKKPTPCNAEFTSTNIGDCGNVQFTNTSTPTTGLTYLWTFGDPTSGTTNNTSTLPNPTHQFTGCGNYTVCLTITGNGCSSTICHTVVVRDNVPPIARCKPGVGVVLNANCQYQVTTAFVDNGSSDNCPNFSMSVNPSLITGCGNTTVTLTVTDWCGNTSTCTMGIQTRETVPPTIVCPPNTTVTCARDTTPSVTGIATATDNCPGVITFTHSDIVSGALPCDGTIRRTWTAKDACGNTSTCVQSIIVRDNVPPTIVCPQNYTVNTNAGLCYYTGILTQPSATDNCDQSLDFVCSLLTATSSILISPQTQFPKGVNNISCIAADDCGNSSTVCNFTLTVVDNQKPTITCPLSISVVGSITPPSTLCKALINGIAPIVTDNCPMWTVTYTVSGATTASGSSDASGTVFMLGVSTVTYIVTDMAGNKDSCKFTINVKCEPCLASFTYTTSGNCNNIQFTNQSSGTPPLTYLWTFDDIPSGTNNTSTAQNPLHSFTGCGTYNVCLYLTTGDGCRDTLCRQITIDNTPPNMTCPPNAVVSCTKDTVPTITGRPTVTDNCPGTVTVSYSDVIIGILPCNATIRRTWTARDACGNTATCVQTITVNDNTPPIITNCPQNVTVNTNAGQCYYTLFGILSINATDACDPTPTVFCTWTDPNGVVLPLTNQTQFPKGVNTIICIANDKCGNNSRPCAFTITVVDNEKPKIICPLSITVAGSITPPSILCKDIVNGLAPTVTDNCTMVNTTYTIASVLNGTTGLGNNDASGTSFMGTSSVTYTATDMAGNTATCSFTVTVRCDSTQLDFKGFSCGQAIISCFSGFKPGTNTADPNGPVIAQVDLREHALAPLGINWAAVSSTSKIYHAPDWSGQKMGQVFGVTIDPQNNVYASGSTIYGIYMPAPLTNAAFGNVYKIDATTGNVVVLATLPQDLANPAGLGDVWYDNINNQLFVSNFYDGLIYRLNPSSGNIIGTYDFPGVTGSPFYAALTAPGFILRGQRVWAVARYANHLYFSVWNEDKGTGRNSSSIRNQIWRVQLDVLGNPIASTESIVHIMSDLITTSTQIYSSPVSDIQFSATGNMLVAERSMDYDFGDAYNNTGSQAHKSRVIELFPPNSWISEKLFYVGNPYNTGGGPTYHANSSGGADYGYESFNPNTSPLPSKCDSMIWTTGDALRFPGFNTVPDPAALLCPSGTTTNDLVYGLAGIRASGNSNNPANTSTFVKTNSIYIDVDNNICRNTKTRIGDIDVFKCGCTTQPSTCDSIAATSVPLNSGSDSCCFKITVQNQKPNFFHRIQLCASNGVSISNLSTLNGWGLISASATMLTVAPPGGFPNTVPVGTQDFIKICLSNYINVPNQQVIVKYLKFNGRDFEAVCFDTLNFNCTQKPKCLKVTDTVICNANGQYQMNFCIMSDPLIGWNVYSFTLNPQPGVTFTPNTFTVTPPLTAGQTRCGFTTIVSGPAATDGQTICYTLTGKGQNNAPPILCCTDTVVKACVTLPTCKCDKLSVSAVSVNLPTDACCWKVTLTNNYSNTYFSGVQLTPLNGVVFGTMNAGPWNMAFSPTQTTITTLLPGTFLGQTSVLPTFCLGGITTSAQVPQYVEVAWLNANGNIVCRDTLIFDCRPIVETDCAVIVNPKIVCSKEIPGAYTFSFQVYNNSSFTVNKVDLDAITGGVLIPTSFAVPPLLPLGTSPVLTTQVYGVPVNGQFCFYLTVHDTATNGNELNCCSHSRKYCFTVPPCDSCVCGGFDILYAVSRGPLLKKNCGDTLFVPASLPIQFISSFYCVGDSCRENPPVTWTLTGPTGFTSIGNTTTATPNIAIPLSNATFTLPGLYNLTMIGQCGTSRCTCKLVFKVDTACCQNREQFIQSVNNAVSISVNNALCKATVNIGNLRNCDEITNIQWGDATTSAGPFAAGSSPMHIYTISGTFVITYLAIERNPATGLICFEYQKRDTIRLSCGVSDSCRCGTFSNMTFRPAQGAQTQSVKCGDTLTLSCNTAFNPVFGGTFLCTGTNCRDSAIRWELRALPSNSLVTSGSLSGPNFNIAIPAVFFATAGMYELTFTGQCGTQSCPPCKFKINVLPPVSLSTGLTGYFPFNGNANDVSPTLINGIPSNLIPATALNGALSAYSFNGTTSWIDGTNNNRGVTDQVSVCAWVRTTELLRGMWVAGQYNGGQFKGYLLSIGDITNSAGSIGLASFSGRVNSGPYYAAISQSNVKVNDGAWHCIIGTAGIGITGVSEWKIYVDATLRGSVPGATSTIAPTNIPFTIGRHSDLFIGTNLMFYNGNMDDVRVYNKVLTQCEIDSMCSIRFVSGVGDINEKMRVSIFPNPNRGTFTLEMSKKATTKMSYRVTNLMGQLIFEKPIEKGSEQQTVEVKDLTEGLYFLHIVSEGKVVAIEKFVKQ
jgi:PKD repeat protein